MIKKFHIKGCENICDQIQIQIQQSTSINPFLKSKQKQSKGIDKVSSLNQTIITEEISKIKKSLTLPFSQNMSNRSNNPKIKSLKTISKTIKRLKTTQNKKKILKNLIKRRKVKDNVNNFVKKISRSLMGNQDIQLQLRQNHQNNRFLLKKGIQLPPFMQVFQLISNTLNFLFLFCVLSLGIAFTQITNHILTKKMYIVSIVITLINIIANFVCVKTINGKKIESLKEIVFLYLKGAFFSDLLCFIVLVLDLAIEEPWTRFMRIIFFCKFNDFLTNIQKIQYNYINTFRKQHYWAICHLMLSNFFIAHLIAIILLLMAQLNTQINWLIKSDLQHHPWYQQYIYAYYWAVTTMLSIGYGDIVVSNHLQAACMVFIQLFSCIILAYTINCVGNLINKLKEKDLEKNKNLKTFKEIVDKNQISSSVEQKIGNYINQTFQIKTRFNYQNQKKLLNQLPKDLKFDILKQCNSKLFKKIDFFKSMSNNIITQLANKIQLKIAHPEQVIFSSSSYQNLVILKEGKVGYYTKENYFKKKYEMNQILVENGDCSRLLSYSFITGTVPNYTINSVKYSVVYILSLQNLIQSFRSYPLDNQRFCYLRDKSKHQINQFQVVFCQICKKMHTRADCPKLHYIPIKQMVVYKYLTKNKKLKSKRLFKERQKYSLNCYKNYIFLRNLKQINQNFNTNGNIQNQNQLCTLTEIIVQHLLGKQTSQSKIKRIKQKNNFQIKQILPTGKTIENISPLKSKSQLQSIRFIDKPSPMGPVEGQKNQQENQGQQKRKVNSIFLVTNKIIKNLKQNNQGSIFQFPGKIRNKKNFTLIAELTEMMGLQCDVLYDYCFYFSEKNPQNMIRNWKNGASTKKTKTRLQIQ